VSAAAVVRREAGPRVALDAAGRLSIRLPGGLLLEGVAAGADVDPGGLLLVRRWRREGDPGPGGGGRLRAEAGGAGGGAHLGLTLEVEARADVVLLRLELRSETDRPVDVRRLVPLAIQAGPGGGALRLETPPDAQGFDSRPLDAPMASPAHRDPKRCFLALPGASTRVLRIGWSVSVPPVPLGPRDRDDASISIPWGLRLSPRALLDMGFDPGAMPESVPGRSVSSHAALLRPLPGGPTLAVGFTSQRRQAGRIRTALGLRAGGSLTAECDTEGLPLAPGETLAAEELLLASEGRAHDALARWARAAGERAGARPRGLRYWCTWYAAPCDRIDPVFLETSLRALRERRAPLDAVVVDDGWQRALGEWLLTNEKFPRGLASIASLIREAGFTPGIWLAPFAVAPHASVARAHPEWLVRGADGRPRPAGWVAQLGRPRPYFALDATHPEAAAHIEATVRAVAALGFRVLKVDFLTAGALAGVRHDPRATRALAYALGMAAVRRGAGDALLMGAIAPHAWNAGWVEAQRAGTDVSFGPPSWETPLARLGDWTSPSVRNALPGMLALAAWDGRLFANDGDCVVARGLAPRLARALALANLAVSSVTAIGDDPRRGDTDALALLERIGAFTGPAAGGGRILDLMDRTIPGEVETADGRRRFGFRWSVRGGVRLTATAGVDDAASRL